MPLMLPDVATDRVRRSGWVRLGGAVKSSPTVANGVVYVGSEDDNLYAFNLPGAAIATPKPTPKTLRPDPNLLPR